jgi:hypothetical protein
LWRTTRFFLQALLQPSADPCSALSFYFHLDLP